jgi:hypothetical protein
VLVSFKQDEAWRRANTKSEQFFTRAAFVVVRVAIFYIMSKQHGSNKTNLFWSPISLFFSRLRDSLRLIKAHFFFCFLLLIGRKQPKKKNRFQQQMGNFCKHQTMCKNQVSAKCRCRDEKLINQL